MGDREQRRAVDEILRGAPPGARQFPALRGSARMPVTALSWGALHHPDPAARRGCLDYLDHLGGPDAAAVFAAALEDPVPRVRRHAIHALTCEVCKEEALDIDVAGLLRRCIAADSSARVRFEALRALVRRAGRAEADAAIGEAEGREDWALFAEVLRARRRSVPAVLRQRAESLLAGVPGS